MNLARGLWGIADGIRDAADARRWEESAADCAGWTLRRPACEDAVSVSILRSWKAAGRVFLTHGRGDLARLCEASGVITGFRGLPLAAMRFAHPGVDCGASAHSPNDAESLIAMSADFLVYGPIWSTPSKSGLVEPRGLDELEAVISLGVPVIAIGGVQTPEQVEACARVGAHGVAVLRAATDAVLCAELADAYASSTKGPCTGRE